MGVSCTPVLLNIQYIYMLKLRKDYGLRIKDSIFGGFFASSGIWKFVPLNFCSGRVNSVFAISLYFMQVLGNPTHTGTARLSIT